MDLKGTTEGEILLPPTVVAREGDWKERRKAKLEADRLKERDEEHEESVECGSEVLLYE